MDLIDRISKHLRVTKRESEARVAAAHRDGNQVIYGGQRRYDSDEHQENVDYYLAGQPEDDIIELTDDMRIEPETKPLFIIKSSWNYRNCMAIGCNKAAIKGCCTAYTNPAMLSWFRQGKACPTGPYLSTVATRAKKINPLKASKRNNK